MSVAPDTSVKLGASKPKKDVVAAVPGTDAAPDEVRLWARLDVKPEFTQQIVGDFHKLYRFAKTNFKDVTGIPATWSMPSGGSDNDIVAGAGTTGSVVIQIGADIHNGDKSHFFDRTFKRLIEYWLELSKGASEPNATGGDAPPPSIRTSDNMNFMFGGNWQPGTRIDWEVTVTDPDDQSNMYPVTVIIPPGAPPEGWDAATAATVNATELDALTHIRATASGVVVTLEPAAPANTVSGLARVTPP